jgi:glyoxylase-like metal-dependent hydrolase (beta-lactamase superfamily II)
VTSSEDVVPGLRRIRLGGDFVNAYLLAHDDGLVLVDTGPPGSADAILAAIGDEPLRRIVLTHAHPDHSGSADAVRAATGAPVLCSAQDAELLASGWASRGLTVLPEMRDTLPLPPGATIEGLLEPAPMDPPLEVDVRIDAGPVPGLPGLEAIAAPGHCAGQLALRWDAHGGVLLAGDAAANFGAIAIAAVGEDLELAARTAGQLAEGSYEVAAFGHGDPVTSGATAALRAAFA